VHWKKVTLVGVGLLGGSLGMALRQRRLASEVCGFVRRAASIAECERAGAVDHATCDLQNAAGGADLIVLCTPIGQMPVLMRQMFGSLKRGVIVTDVGSVKANLVKHMEALLVSRGVHFVGSHPMAGSEKTGVAAARANLFDRTVCVVTPTGRSNNTAVVKVKRLWKGVGARVLTLSPEQHDQLVSRSSHLPHVIAAQLTNVVLNSKYSNAQRTLCANGFRDTTRIASGSPEMWRDIAIANRKNLDRALQVFIRGLENFRGSLRRGDTRAIAKFFEMGKQRRDSWSAANGSSSPE
jgi:prephenate dehydrogenase